MEKKKPAVSLTETQRDLTVSQPDYQKWKMYSYYQAIMKMVCNKWLICENWILICSLKQSNISEKFIMITYQFTSDKIKANFYLKNFK